MNYRRLRRIGVYIILGGLALDLAISLRPERFSIAGFEWEPLSIALVPIGMLMLLIAMIGRSTEKTIRSTTILFLTTPGSQSQDVQTETASITDRCFSMFGRQFVVNKPIPILPSFGPFLAMALLLVSCFVFFLDTIFYRYSQGLWVSIPRQDGEKTARLSLEGKIIFQVDAENRWYLNAKRISPEELPRALTQVLARRPDLVVYFEAAPNLDYKDAISAMNAIRNVHAQIILITPRIRANSP